MNTLQTTINDCHFKIFGWLSIADVARMYAGAAGNETIQESCLEPTVLRQAWKNSYRLGSKERYLNGLNAGGKMPSKISFLHLISLHHIAPLSFNKFFCRDEWIRLCSEKDRNAQEDQNIDKVSFKSFLEMYTAGSKEMRAFCMEEKVLDNVCKDNRICAEFKTTYNCLHLNRGEQKTVSEILTCDKQFWIECY